MRVMKVVSGGQTGVDRGALDAAIHSGLPHGGWVPLGRIAEDGPLGPTYVVQETPIAETTLRTEWNIRDSRATLILASGELKQGTELTWRLANILGKPVFRVDLDTIRHEEAVGTVIAWLNKIRPSILNVAGPRESEAPGIHARARSLLVCVFSAVGICSETECRDSEDVTVVVARYEQAQANFRHWDQIRWLTPYWFIALFCGYVALITSEKTHPVIEMGAFIGLIIFAGVCLRLMNRLIHYHNSEMDACRDVVEQSPLSPYQRGVLLGKLPFELKGKRLWRTATGLFILLICALMIVAVILLIAELRH